MCTSKKRKFVKQYLFFYLLSLLTPLIMGVLIYIITYNMEYKRVEQENIWKLNQAMEKLNQGLIEAERLSIQLLSDESVKALARKKALFTPGEIYSATQFLQQNSLIPKVLLNDLFLDYYIFESPERYVFSQDMVSPFSSFYRYDYKGENLKAEDFHTFLTETALSGFYPQLRIRDRKDPQKFSIPYFHFYQESTVSRRIVMVLFDPEKIEALFSSSPEDEGKQRVILSYNGIPLAKRTERIPPQILLPEENEQQEMVKIRNRYVTLSNYQNWSCMLLQPANAVSKNIADIPQLILSMMGGILLLGLIFLLFLAYQSSRPILFLLEKMRQDKDLPHTGKDALSTLDFFVEQMKGQNHQLEEKIAEQKTKLKTNFLTSLLYDIVPNPAQIPTLARHAGVQLTQNPIGTAVIQLKGKETSLGQEWEHLFPISLIALQNSIYKEFGPQAYIIQISLNEICLLVNFPESSKEKKKERLIQILKKWAEEDLQETFVIGISPYHYGWREVARSFREAKAALIYNWPHNEGMVNLYQEKKTTRREDELYFPREMDHVILDAVRSGQSKELRECLLKISRENLELRKLEPFAQNILISHFKEILVNAKSNLEIEDPSLLTRLNSTIQEPAEQLNLFLSQADSCLMELCDYFYSDQTKKELKIAERIKDVLEENFHRNQLSLTMTAEDLGLTSQYLTGLIKKYYGKTFRHYMEDLRMEYVRKLIMETSDPIHQLIQRGGYNSMNTFCKAFKRKYGYKASSLREGLTPH